MCVVTSRCVAGWSAENKKEESVVSVICRLFLSRGLQSASKEEAFFRCYHVLLRLRLLLLFAADGCFSSSSVILLQVVVIVLAPFSVALVILLHPPPRAVASALSQFSFTAPGSARG